jgi:maleate cis-trans isomerase
VVRLPVAITSVGEDAHRVGSDARLADGAALLAGEKPDAVMWACTSGSFVFGPQGARDQMVAMVAAADHPDAEEVLVPDTAMHTLAIIDKLEAAVDKPVLTANQVTVWKGLELLGQVSPLPGLGTLFGDRR